MAAHSCSCLGNPRDGGDYWAAFYGAAESDTTEATQQQQQQQIILKLLKLLFLVQMEKREG